MIRKTGKPGHRNIGRGSPGSYTKKDSEVRTLQVRADTTGEFEALAGLEARVGPGAVPSQQEAEREVVRAHEQPHLEPREPLLHGRQQHAPAAAPARWRAPGGSGGGVRSHREEALPRAAAW